MKYSSFKFGMALLLSLAAAPRTQAAETSTAAEAQFTPPAVPLVACDPYFSIWSAGTKLTDKNTTHWTGKPHRLSSLVRIDGDAFRLMGADPVSTPTLEQQQLTVTPTQSRYQFAGAGVEITLIFTTPSLPADIDLLSRPITYLTYQVRATDDKQHDVQLYFAASAELAVNTPIQEAAWSIEHFGDVKAFKIGSTSQQILSQSGDDIRIDWGYFYLAAADDQRAKLSVGTPAELHKAFENGKLPERDAEFKEAPAGEFVAALSFDLPQVGADKIERYLVLAYDDLYSIEFMYRKLRPYWRRDGLEADGLLKQAVRDYDSLIKRCNEFDESLLGDLTTLGGAEYARIAALAYRQCFAAGKFVADANGQPIQFCKENHSNGCIATSDVFYPMSPQFLLFGPSLSKSFLVPFMEYAASDRWKFPFAPHDLGTYPKANGQVYGGGERSKENQMPVEESGNLLILMAAVAKVEGNTEFADQYWDQLTEWANYLQQKGFDPDNQLCTDDFAGHLAHNVNLSAKAICGLGAFAQLCEMRGDSQQAESYRKSATAFAVRWMEEANDGDHYRLAFDRPDTWSQKYNLVWDRVLGLDLFPDEVREKEMKFYRTKQKRFGLPLDNRKAYTKLDWILWTATLTQERSDFQALVHPVYEFLNETPDHTPMTDWYQTKTGRKVGFDARPVVGGVFMQMLYNDLIWKKWASQDETDAGGYAPMPKPPKVTVVLPAADTKPAAWQYTTQRPQGDWQQADYDDSSWQSGKSGFGAKGTPGARIGTPWNTLDIWIRRKFDLPADTSIADLKLYMHHDEDVEVYFNGVLAAKIKGFTADYQTSAIRPEAVEALKKAGNTVAVHCHQTGGGQYIDLGLATVEQVEP